MGWLLAGLIGIGAATAAQAVETPREGRTSAELYRAACAACHGEDGAGATRDRLGFDPPPTFPDFSDCAQATPEQDVAWRAIIRDGGRARGFSEIMPAFGDALSAAQIRSLVSRLRSFCRDDRWPRGELNVPKALLTEKAFPENETLVSLGFDTDDSKGIDGEIAYERRFGARSQLELALPFASISAADGRDKGVGDLAVGVKHVVLSRYDDATRRGAIAAVQAEVSLPTGDSGRGLGAGTPVFTTFGAVDVLLPARGFLQLQAGLDLPADVHDAPRTAFVRSAIGFSASSGGGYGRTWSPMLEVAGERALDGSEPWMWDLAPGVQMTLNARQHVRAALGYRAALTQRSIRSDQVLLYVLWDWGDGGLGDGW